MGFKRTSSEAFSTSCGSGVTWATTACTTSIVEVTGALTSSGRVNDFSGVGSAAGIGASRSSPRADPFSTGLSACPGTFSTCAGSTSDPFWYDDGARAGWGSGNGGLGGAVYTLLTKP